MIEYIAIALMLAILGLLIYNSFFKTPILPPKDDSGMLLMQQQMQQLSETMDRKLTESNRTMHEGSQVQFRESKELIQAVNREVNEQLRHVIKGVSEVGESSKQVFEVADQLKELQNILKNPKQRGILGEYYLETVLNNVLPPESFQMQYGFEDGEIVDAAVFVKGKVIPVDSKFSLENYNRYIEAAEGADKAQYEKVFLNDLKLRITETAKYIRPTEKRQILLLCLFHTKESTTIYCLIRWERERRT